MDEVVHCVIQTLADISMWVAPNTHALGIMTLELLDVSSTQAIMLSALAQPRRTGYDWNAYMLSGAVHSLQHVTGGQQTGQAFCIHEQSHPPTACSMLQLKSTCFS